jgi:hypothetical protein
MVKNNKKQKNNNKRNSNNKRGHYHCFNDKLTRNSVIQEYAIRYLDNVPNNDSGRCDRGFMTKLVQEAHSNNQELKITLSEMKHRELWPNKEKNSQSFPTRLKHLQ